MYWQITRGVAKRDHSFPKDVEPTVFMMSNPLPKLTAEQVDNGVPCYTFPTSAGIAATSRAFHCSAMCWPKQHATEHGGAEVVMIRDGFMTEASASNVFCVFGDTIVSPPKDNHILGGITLDGVFDPGEEEWTETRSASGAGGRDMGGRRTVAIVLQQGCAGDHHARRQTNRQCCAQRGKPGPMFKRCSP